MEGRKRPGWKRVKDKQAKAIILEPVSKRSGGKYGSVSHSVQNKELIFLLHKGITPTTSHLGNTKADEC